MTQDHEPDELVIVNHRGLVCVIVQLDEHEWRADRIVVDALADIEWRLPGCTFPSEQTTFDYMRAVIDAAFPRTRFGETVEACWPPHEKSETD